MSTEASSFPPAGPRLVIKQQTEGESMTGITTGLLAIGFSMGVAVSASLAWAADPMTKMPRSSTGQCQIDFRGRIGLALLDTCRPKPISTARKHAILRSLPAEGEVTTLEFASRRKLKALAPVLQAHRRREVYEIKVVDVPQAWTGLHARAVLLISLPAIELLSTEELQALVAHETGHEYLWQEFQAAQSRGLPQRLQKLEAACDAIAVLTLQALGISPENLIAALQKVARFNREQFGTPRNWNNYPSLEERRQLINQLAKRETTTRKTSQGISVSH